MMRIFKSGKGAAMAMAVIANLLSVAMPTESSAQVRATQAPTNSRTTAFCPNNRFTNGNFATILPGQPINSDELIASAQGWRPLWTGSSLADLYQEDRVPHQDFTRPTPFNGNYASMWVSNSPSDPMDRREGMFNLLTTPIAANTGVYNFTFKVAPLHNGGATRIGIYGVNRAANATLPNAPTGLTTPTNLALFGAGNSVLLGTVLVPAGGTSAWQNVTVQFDSAAFGSLAQINHVMVTRPDTVSPASSARYLAFDDFCMRTVAEDAQDSGGGTGGTGGSGGTGGAGGTGGNGTSNPSAPGACPGTSCTNQDYSTCCPPTARYQWTNSWRAVQPNIGAGYHLEFALNNDINSQMQAYVNLLRTMDPNFQGIAMSIRAFNGGTGATAVPTGPQLEPDNGIYWQPGQAAGSMWPNNAFFTSASDLPTNTWIVVEMVTWPINGSGRYWSQDCEVIRIAWRPQLGARTRAGSGLNFVPVVSRQPAARGRMRPRG
jgi:hypothetical protein